MIDLKLNIDNVFDEPEVSSRLSGRWARARCASNSPALAST